MSRKKYVVISPYITLRAKDDTGAEVLSGFHQGAPVPEGVNQEDLDRHLRKGMVAEDGTDEARLLGVPAGTPIPGEPPNVPVTEASGAVPPTEERLRRAQEAESSGPGRGRRSSTRSGEESKAAAKSDDKG